jgi:hypothetical protein
MHGKGKVNRRDGFANIAGNNWVMIHQRCAPQRDNEIKHLSHRSAGSKTNKEAAKRRRCDACQITTS